jgi:hypothetical protein
MRATGPILWGRSAQFHHSRRAVTGSNVAKTEPASNISYRGGRPVNRDSLHLDGD